jgi:hypothetical protein
MSKRLPYFQFEPAQYITKDIQFCSLASQGLFINICAIYWQRDCNLTIEQLKRRFNEQDLINELIKEKIISIDKDSIVISFLDSQYEIASGTKISRSNAGKKSAQLKKIRKEIKERLTFIASETGKDLTKLIDEYQLNSTSVDFLLQQNSTIKIIEDNIKENKEDEIKEDEIKEDEIKKDTPNIPPFDEFLEYAIEKKPKVCPIELKLKYEAWKENGWKDGHDKTINKWRSKLLQTLPYIKDKSFSSPNGPSIPSYRF